MRIILLILMMTLQACAQDYSRLKEYKQTHPKEMKTIRSKSYSSQPSVMSNKFVVRFHDINHFDFASFEEIYKVELLHCIAYGICIYENKSSASTDVLIKKIRTEKSDIKSIRPYQNYKMKAF